MLGWVELGDINRDRHAEIHSPMRLCPATSPGRSTRIRLPNVPEFERPKTGNGPLWTRCDVGPDG